MRPERLSASHWTALLGEEMLAHHEARRLGRSHRFVLPGVDPFSYDTPAQVIAAVYGSLSAKPRVRFEQALLDLVGMRAELLVPRAIEDLLLTVGYTQLTTLLKSMVNVIVARRDLGPSLHLVYATAIQVIRGFGPREAAWEAARVLSGSREFPPDLVFDALDARLLDHRIPWTDWFTQLEFLMYSHLSVSKLPVVHLRLRDSADELSQGDVDRIAEGISALWPEGLDTDLADLRHSSDPKDMLLTALLAESTSPLLRVVNSRGRYVLRKRNGPGRSSTPLIGPAPARDKVEAAPAIRFLEVA